MRYQVIGYASECGADERKEHNTIREAMKECRELKKSGWETALIYDKRTQRVREVYGSFPPSAAPISKGVF